MNQFTSLESERWYVLPTRKRRPFFVDFWTFDLGHPSIDIGFDYQIKHVGHFKDQVLIDQSSWDHQRATLQSGIRKDPWFLKKLLDNAQRHFDEILFLYFKSLPRNPGSNRQELAITLETFRGQMSQYCTYIILPLYVEDDLTGEVREGLKAHGSVEQAAEFFELSNLSCW